MIVTIAIPARPQYLALLRAACAHLAPVLGCTLAETADLRLAVDEAAGFLLRNCITPASRDQDQDRDRNRERDRDPDQLAATFVADESALQVTLELAAEVFVPPDGDEFGWAILTTLVDDCAWSIEGSTARVQIRKRRADGR